MKFLLSRVPGLVFTLLGITVFSFALMHLAPGDPTQLAGDFDPRAHANAAMQAAYGLDKPLPQQYLTWVGHMLRLNFGTSLAPDGRPVMDKIAEALPITLGLNGVGLMLTLLFSIPLGVAVALRPRSVPDTLTTVLLYLFLAAPSVWLALLGLQFFGIMLGWLPLSGLHSFGAENWGWGPWLLDLMAHTALPVAVGVVGSLAGLTRFVRSSMLETLKQDYVLTARAKGAPEARVLSHHALRNALLPVVTILGLSLPGLIGGSVIMESLFALPGLGQLFYNSVLMRDYPTIMALLTLGAVLTLLGNLLADAAYAWVDPRTEFVK
jgi:peptide/nickel transport system permease protein